MRSRSDGIITVSRRVPNDLTNALRSLVTQQNGFPPLNTHRQMKRFQVPIEQGRSVLMEGMHGHDHVRLQCR